MPGNKKEILLRAQTTPEDAIDDFIVWMMVNKDHELLTTQSLYNYWCTYRRERDV